MSPLHLCLQARKCRTLSAAGLSLLVVAGLSVTLRASVPAPRRAQDTAPVTATLPNFHARPRVMADPQRARRTVQLNGILNEGKYDPFYTLADGPVKGTIYCNWDENYLYLAARTDSPASLVFDIDASNDGWLRGADNLEVVVSSVDSSGGAPAITARLLDASNSRETPIWRDLTTDAASIKTAGSLDAAGQVVEVAIPRSMGLTLRAGATIGLRGEFLTPGQASAYMPTPPFEPHLLLDATLVETRSANAPVLPVAAPISLPAVPAPAPPAVSSPVQTPMPPAATPTQIVGLLPRLTLSDNKCVPGQKLFATLELINQTDARVTLKALTWAGQGGAANAVNTMRDISIPVIGPLKRLKLNYKTTLAADLQPGAYTLTATGELENGKQIQSSASFQVVEPLYPQISILPDPVTVVGPTSFAVSVDVVNANPGQMNCEIELLNLPATWEVEGNRKKLPLTIDKEDGRGARQFVVRLPMGTMPGDYPIDATVTWHQRTWKLHTVAHVLHPEPPKTTP